MLLIGIPMSFFYSHYNIYFMLRIYISIYHKKITYTNFINYKKKQLIFLDSIMRIIILES